jgi:uncharacterized protein (TIGR03086 family)
MTESDEPQLGILAAHRGALDATGTLIAGVADDQWNLPTPCAEWSVRELVNHIVSGNLLAAELAAGRTIDEVGDRLDGDVLGDDPSAAYRRSAELAAQAFEAPGALDAPAAVSYGPVPGSVYAGHRFIDVLIHGWDVATATGQDATLDPPLVERCWDELEPQLGMLQASGMFGIPSTDGENPTERLLGALGR